MLEVRLIEDKLIWNEFLDITPEARYPQAWEWGEFEKSLGKNVFRVGVYKSTSEGNETSGGVSLIAVAQFVKEVGRFGTFYYAPRGPVINYSEVSAEEQGEIFKSLIDYLKQQGSFVFARFDPALDLEAADGRGEVAAATEETFKEAGFTHAVNFVLVERAFVHDVIPNASEEDLMRNAVAQGLSNHTKRYINRAFKRGVEIKVDDSEEALNGFVSLMEEFTSAKRFPMRGTREYFRKQLLALREGGMVKIFTAYWEGAAVATLYAIQYKDELSFMHGGFLNKYRELAPSFAMHWAAIRYCSENQIARYNFWGILREEDMAPNHPWYGFSLFKRGFGGRAEQYLRTKDFVGNWLPYQLYRLQEFYRKKRFHID